MSQMHQSEREAPILGWRHSLRLQWKSEEIYEEVRNLDGHDRQRSSQELGDDITGCSRPGRLTSCWTGRGKPGNQFRPVFNCSSTVRLQSILRIEYII